jgi:hypothetical protein
MALAAAIFALLSAPSVYERELKITTADTMLPAPAQRSWLLRLDLRRAPAKPRLMFTSPLARGRYRVRIIAQAGEGRTVVVAVPLAVGRSSFEVSIEGAGRFDLGFWADGPRAAHREYRFTLHAPVEQRLFDLQMPFKEWRDGIVTPQGSSTPSRSIR